MRHWSWPVAMEWLSGKPAAASAGYPELTVDAIKPPNGVSELQAEHRLEMWKVLEDGFLTNHASASPGAHRTVYDNALRMIHSDASAAFDLSKESAKVREKYGKGVFGQGCLLARRLVEMGVPFVEVSLGNGGAAWDTHANGFETEKGLCAELDAGWSSLMSDLSDRGLLDRTTIVWMGEFGRTPRINARPGATISRKLGPACWRVAASPADKHTDAPAKTA